MEWKTIPTKNKVNFFLLQKLVNKPAQIIDLVIKFNTFKVGPSKIFAFISFTESSLKVMKDAFYFMPKALFVLEIFTFLYRIFSYVEKRLDEKAVVNFKIYHVTDWIKNLCKIHIVQYLKK